MDIAVDGANVEAGFNDQFGNQPISSPPKATATASISSASGEVETEDRSGVLRAASGLCAALAYLRDTPLTKPAN